MTKDGRGCAVLRKRATCKKCGCDHVCWYQTKGGKWILLEGKLDSQGNGVWAAGGNFHNCENYLKRNELEKQEIKKEVIQIKWNLYKNLIEYSEVSPVSEENFQNYLNTMYKRNYKYIDIKDGKGIQEIKELIK